MFLAIELVFLGLLLACFRTSSPSRKPRCSRFFCELGHLKTFIVLFQLSLVWRYTGYGYGAGNFDWPIYSVTDHKITSRLLWSSAEKDPSTADDFSRFKIPTGYFTGASSSAFYWGVRQNIVIYRRGIGCRETSFDKQINTVLHIPGKYPVFLF